MALVPIVVVLLVIGLIWRARSTRRLTIEESVDRYRRTLSAVHDASTRARPADAAPRPERPKLNAPRLDAPRFEPARFEPARSRTKWTRSNRAAALASRGSLVVAAMALVTAVVVVVVIAAGHGKPSHHASAPTTTTPPATQPTTTTRPAPTTTVPLVTTSGATGTTFTVSKPTYTIVVQTTTAACWVDMRDPSGTRLFSGTLSVGASQAITASAVTLRLGNPAAATVTIDGTSVPFSLASGSPVTLHFQGSGAPA